MRLCVNARLHFHCEIEIYFIAFVMKPYVIHVISVCFLFHLYFLLNRRKIRVYLLDEYTQQKYGENEAPPLKKTQML